jgi:RNA polymerase sigma factor (sigma-70 family)
MLLKQCNLKECEETLIKGCINGDRTFQSRLYSRFAKKMLGVCLRYARNKEEAEEILNEGFFRVFTYLHKFKGQGSLEGWIRKIMVNCALLKYKRESKIFAVSNLSTVSYEFPDDTDIAADLGKKELLQLIQALPPAYRLVFNLYVFEGYKHREIAELLDISEGTSKSNLFDARAILQKAIRANAEVVNYKFY